jgi:histidine phosphotransferase ChpT
MASDPNLEMAQLWISHLCHELVNPVGALNNGIELIEDGEAGDLQQEALDLIALSGRVVASRLRFFRLAYGRSGNAQGFSLSDARKAVIDYFVTEKTTKLEWPESALPACVAGSAQLLMNVSVLAASALPRGGIVRVTLSAGQRHLAAMIEATGAPARLDLPVLSAARGLSQAIDYHNAHAMMCARLAGNLGERLEIVETDGLVQISAALPLDHEP